MSLKSKKKAKGQGVKGTGESPPPKGIKKGGGGGGMKQKKKGKKTSSAKGQHHKGQGKKDQPKGNFRTPQKAEKGVGKKKEPLAGGQKKAKAKKKEAGGATTEQAKEMPKGSATAPGKAKKKAKKRKEFEFLEDEEPKSKRKKWKDVQFKEGEKEKTKKKSQKKKWKDVEFKEGEKEKTKKKSQEKQGASKPKKKKPKKHPAQHPKKHPKKKGPASAPKKGGSESPFENAEGAGKLDERGLPPRQHLHMSYDEVMGQLNDIEQFQRKVNPKRMAMLNNRIRNRMLLSRKKAPRPRRGPSASAERVVASAKREDLVYEGDIVRRETLVRTQRASKITDNLAGRSRREAFGETWEEGEEETSDADEDRSAEDASSSAEDKEAMAKTVGNVMVNEESKELFKSEGASEDEMAEPASEPTDDGDDKSEEGGDATTVGEGSVENLTSERLAVLRRERDDVYDERFAFSDEVADVPEREEKGDFGTKEEIKDMVDKVMRKHVRSRTDRQIAQVDVDKIDGESESLSESSDNGVALKRSREAENRGEAKQELPWEQSGSTQHESQDYSHGLDLSEKVATTSRKNSGERSLLNTSSSTPEAKPSESPRKAKYKEDRKQLENKMEEVEEILEQDTKNLDDEIKDMDHSGSILDRESPFGTSKKNNADKTLEKYSDEHQASSEEEEAMPKHRIDRDSANEQELISEKDEVDRSEDKSDQIKNEISEMVRTKIMTKLSQEDHQAKADVSNGKKLRRELSKLVGRTMKNLKERASEDVVKEEEKKEKELLMNRAATKATHRDLSAEFGKIFAEEVDATTTDNADHDDAVDRLAIASNSTLNKDFLQEKRRAKKQTEREKEDEMPGEDLREDTELPQENLEEEEQHSGVGVKQAQLGILVRGDSSGRADEGPQVITTISNVKVAENEEETSVNRQAALNTREESVKVTQVATTTLLNSEGEHEREEATITEDIREENDVPLEISDRSAASDWHHKGAIEVREAKKDKLLKDVESFLEERLPSKLSGKEEKSGLSSSRERNKKDEILKGVETLLEEKIPAKLDDERGKVGGKDEGKTLSDVEKFSAEKLPGKLNDELGKLKLKVKLFGPGVKDVGGGKDNRASRRRMNVVAENAKEKGGSGNLNDKVAKPQSEIGQVVDKASKFQDELSDGGKITSRKSEGADLERRVERFLEERLRSHLSRDAGTKAKDDAASGAGGGGKAREKKIVRAVQKFLEKKLESKFGVGRGGKGERGGGGGGGGGKKPKGEPASKNDEDAGDQEFLRTFERLLEENLEKMKEENRGKLGEGEEDDEDEGEVNEEPQEAMLRAVEERLEEYIGEDFDQATGEKDGEDQDQDHRGEVLGVIENELGRRIQHEFDSDPTSKGKAGRDHHHGGQEERKQIQNALELVRRLKKRQNLQGRRGDQRDSSDEVLRKTERLLEREIPRRFRLGVRERRGRKREGEIEERAEHKNNGTLAGVEKELDKILKQTEKALEDQLKGSVRDRKANPGKSHPVSSNPPTGKVRGNRRGEEKEEALTSRSKSTKLNFQ